MLVIHEIEKIDYNSLIINKRKSKKTQIFLYDTQRRFDDFVNKIEHRNNGKFDDIPHFIVTKLGSIYQLFDTNYSSNTFNDSQNDKRMIKIAIENLGWLIRIPSLVSLIIGLETRIGQNLIYVTGETTIFGISTLKSK